MLIILLYKVLTFYREWNCQMKATEQYFPVVIFIMLHNVVLFFHSMDEILKCDHSNESHWAVFSCGAFCFSIFYNIYFGIRSLALFWVKELIISRSFDSCQSNSYNVLGHEVQANSLTSVLVYNLLTLLTFYLATPKKYTVAISRNLRLLDVMTASAT